MGRVLLFLWDRQVGVKATNSSLRRDRKQLVENVGRVVLRLELLQPRVVVAKDITGLLVVFCDRN